MFQKYNIMDFSHLLIFICVFIFILIVLDCGLSWKFRPLFQNQLVLRPSLQLPPSIPGIPIFGLLIHIYLFAKNYTEKFTEIKSRYGKITTVQLGSYRCIWINDAKLIREAWTNQIFCSRPIEIPGIADRTFGYSGGLIFNDGPNFQEQRRFTLKNLKHLGLNKASMEGLIQEEIKIVVHAIKATNSVPICTEKYFHAASINVLWKIVAGEPFEVQLTQIEMSQLFHALDRNMKINHGAKLGFFLPWLTKLCPKLIGWNNYLEDAKLIFTFWQNYVQKRFSLVRNADNQVKGKENFIDLYIKEVQQCKDPNSSFYGAQGEISLALVLQDLFIAGTETTATTIRWALLYLAVFQEVQWKLFDEIRLIVDLSRPDNKVRLDHRSRMVYTEAFIYEVLRFGTLAPLGMLHKTSQDILLNGYFIPKDCIVQANICGSHRDPEYWTNPNEFNPQRFIIRNEEGTESILKPMNIGFLAFSYGKRRCIGETLAKDELFLFIANIVKEFQIDLVYKGKGKAVQFDLEPDIGISAAPKKHKLIFKSRNLQM